MEKRSTVQEAVETVLDSESDSESGAESFLTDEELDYLQRLDPAEDVEPEECQRSVPTPSSSHTPDSPPLRPSTDALLTSPTAPTSRGRTPRARTRKRRNRTRSTSSSRSRSPLTSRPAPEQTRWKSAQDPDTNFSNKKFTPKRKPGHQLDTSKTYTPLDLFSLFVDRSTIIKLCTNINKQAAKNIAKGKKYKWTKLEETDFYRFLGLTFYFALVKLSAIADYWKQNSIFSLQFPPKVMHRDRYRTISWNIHMSDPDEDIDNVRKKGTPQYDKLHRLRPLLDTLTTACKSHYHPRQNIAIDERMVTTKARIGRTQYIKAKPTKWGFKLFGLADSHNGYTVDFAVYTGKSQFPSGRGLAYDSVVSLINPSFLGGGYHLYVDNFYTSPKLFKDLYRMNVGACGTYRENRQDCPRSQNNALTKNDPRGTIRWLRDGPLVFVKWMDSREVAICSTIHPAFTGETVKRRFKGADGGWAAKSIPCPNLVIEYNKYMGGVHLSDQLIQYYSTRHTTMCWYRTLFYHFLDISATNAYILHKELCHERKQTPMTHRGFLEELSAQLIGVTITVPPSKAPERHLPVSISEPEVKRKRASSGRRCCVLCKTILHKRLVTPWKCQACDVALCLIPDRNCFFMWHQNQ